MFICKFSAGFCSTSSKNTVIRVIRVRMPCIFSVSTQHFKHYQKYFERWPSGSQADRNGRSWKSTITLVGPLGMDLTMMQSGKAKRLGSNRMLPSQHMVSHVPVVESLVIFWTFTNISLGLIWRTKKWEVSKLASMVAKKSPLNPRSALLVCSPYPQIRKLGKHP